MGEGGGEVVHGPIKASTKEEVSERGGKMVHKLGIVFTNAEVGKLARQVIEREIVLLAKCNGREGLGEVVCWATKAISESKQG